MNLPGQNSESADLLAPPHTGALAAMLADPPMAELLRGPWPPMFAACGPEPRVVWATPQALGLFGAASLHQLSLRIFAGGSQGSTRLAGLAVALPPDDKPRLERLRFAQGPLTGPMTCLVRRYRAPGGGALFAVAVLGVRAPQGAADTTAILDEAAFAAGTQAAPSAEIAPEWIAASPGAGALPVSKDRAFRRFVWQTNAQHRLTAIGPEFAAPLGGAAALAAGDNLDAFLAAAFVDPEGQARRALAARRTWNGVTIYCPSADGGARLPVTLGAAPLHDRDGAFTGFRGYGITHSARLIDAAPAPDTPAADEFLPAPIQIENSQAGAAAVISAEGDARTAFASAKAAAVAEPGPAAETLAADGPAIDLEPRAPPITVPHAPGIVLLRASAPLISAAQASPNVVPIRPAPPAAPPPRPALRAVKTAEPHRADPSAPVTLSPVERSAFREIARALGARTFDDTQDAAELNSAEQAQGAGSPDGVVTPAPPLGAEPPDTAPASVSFGGASQPVRKIAAEAPADSELDSLRRNAAHLLDRLPVGIIVCRGDAPIFVNRTQLDLLGYEDADDFYLKGGISRMFRGRQPEALDPGSTGGAVPVVAADGEILAVDARLQTISWDGLPATLISFRRAAEPEAVPRLRAVELDLRAREAELRELHAILDTATDGVAVIDEAGRILSLNRSAQAVFGYDLNEVAGESFSLLFAQQSHAMVSDYFDRLRGGGLSSVLNDGREVIGRERQGGAIPLYLTLGRIGQADGGKFCAVLRDLTQFRRAERELGEARKNAERASALKSDFLAKVSHEIRTPLNSILGFTEVIMDERLGPVGNDRYKDYLRDIHASGSHVLSLVNDLLDLSKIESGKADMNFIAVDANRIISESVSLMQPQAAKVRVVMRLSLAGQLPSVVADERSLRQIVLNLLSNAIKFTEPGGQIIISTAMTESGNAAIRVKDTGIGMTEEEIGAALEPFRQIATSRKTVGTGLGLPLTKALIEANRASLSIKSRRNEGTLVEVMFPATRVLAE